MVNYGRERFGLVLKPISGKALPVFRGEVLRITLIEGAQCVDFNCYNLHDYKEHMSVGHMRMAFGFRPKKGDYVLSNPPRYNPMMAILEMPDTCITDLLGSRCFAILFEKRYGYEVHTNCQDTFSECIGEYGLTADDVHDSFNLWMASGWDNFGTYYPSVGVNPGRPGDFVDFLALIDVLAVPIICGSGSDNNFWSKPIKIQAFEPSKDTNTLVEEHQERYDYKSRKGLADFRVKEIRLERELKSIPGYKPNFINYPLKIVEVTLELREKDWEQVKRLKGSGLGATDEEVIRWAVMDWCRNNQNEVRIK